MLFAGLDGPVRIGKILSESVLVRCHEWKYRPIFPIEVDGYFILLVHCKSHLNSEDIEFRDTQQKLKDPLNFYFVVKLLSMLGN